MSMGLSFTTVVRRRSRLITAHGAHRSFRNHKEIDGSMNLRSWGLPIHLKRRFQRSTQMADGEQNLQNKSVEATAVSATSSLRSGRLFSAVPNFKRSLEILLWHGSLYDDLFRCKTYPTTQRLRIKAPPSTWTLAVWIRHGLWVTLLFREGNCHQSTKQETSIFRQ